mmetsp:Transcript_33980/g.46606  ORF Transcript_33980/g.46606 Transcript_33980/m.46606 type:complete len:111 (-) Transcript_33980:2942-3274(-)
MNEAILVNSKGSRCVHTPSSSGFRKIDGAVASAECIWSTDEIGKLMELPYILRSLKKQIVEANSRGSCVLHSSNYYPIVHIESTNNASHRYRHIQNHINVFHKICSPVKL